MAYLNLTLIVLLYGLNCKTERRVAPKKGRNNEVGAMNACLDTAHLIEIREAVALGPHLRRDDQRLLWQKRKALMQWDNATAGECAPGFDDR